jgi:hypothetical protein
MIQFVSPTVQLLLAVTVLGEWDAMTWDKWAAMGCVWVASAVFIADAVVQNRQVRRAVRGGSEVGTPPPRSSQFAPADLSAAERR